MQRLQGQKKLGKFNSGPWQRRLWESPAVERGLMVPSPHPTACRQAQHPQLPMLLKVRGKFHPGKQPWNWCRGPGSSPSEAFFQLLFMTMADSGIALPPLGAAPACISVTLPSSAPQTELNARGTFCTFSTRTQPSFSFLPEL